LAYAIRQISHASDPCANATAEAHASRRLRQRAGVRLALEPHDRDVAAERSSAGRRLPPGQREHRPACRATFLPGPEARARAPLLDLRRLTPSLSNHVSDRTARPAHDVVVVVPDPRRVAGHRARPGDGRTRPAAGKARSTSSTAWGDTSPRLSRTRPLIELVSASGCSYTGGQHRYPRTRDAQGSPTRHTLELRGRRHPQLLGSIQISGAGLRRHSRLSRPGPIGTLACFRARPCMSCPRLWSSHLLELLQLRCYPILRCPRDRVSLSRLTRTG
jgi:hypothetical protein